MRYLIDCNHSSLVSAWTALVVTVAGAADKPGTFIYYYYFLNNKSVKLAKNLSLTDWQWL